MFEPTERKPPFPRLRLMSALGCLALLAAACTPLDLVSTQSGAEEQIGVEEDAEQPSSGVDLTIGNGGWAGRFEPIDPDKPDPASTSTASRFGRRTGILIAWRNTKQVENVEILVRNLGDTPGTGQLSVDLIDARTGQLLASRPGIGEPLAVELPAATDGGNEGEIYTLIASRKINNLVDQLDRDGTPYLIRATVDSNEPDVNLSNNVATKSYFSATLARAHSQHQREFYFHNLGQEPVSFELRLRSTSLPNGWTLAMDPEPGSELTLQPDEMVQGLLTLQTAEHVEEAEHLDAVVSGVAVDTGEVLYQDEWFVDVDNEPPTILSSEIEYERDTNMVVAEALVEDPNSGIMEASGVRIEFTSAEQIFTVADKTMAYKAGNFTTPTSFEARVGPFEPGTTILARITALDTIGNVAHSDVTVIEVPMDARGTEVPEPWVSPFVDEGGEVFVPTFPGRAVDGEEGGD